MVSPENIRTLKTGITALCAAFTAAFGGTGWLSLLFPLAMALDYATGSAAAIKAGEWSSGAARSGLAHKGGMIAAVLAAAFLDGAMYVLVTFLPAIHLPFDYPALATPLVLCWYVLTEIGSVIENAAKLGAPIPPFLKKALAALSHTLDETGSRQ